jgi:hypothetical protein
MWFGGTNALTKRFLEASGTMMFFQQIAKSFVRQFLKAHRPISRELIEGDEVFRFKLDDLAAHRYPRNACSTFWRLLPTCLTVFFTFRSELPAFFAS